MRPQNVCRAAGVPSTRRSGTCAARTSRSLPVGQLVRSDEQAHPVVRRSARCGLVELGLVVVAVQTQLLEQARPAVGEDARSSGPARPGVPSSTHVGPLRIGDDRSGVEGGSVRAGPFAPLRRRRRRGAPAFPAPRRRESGVVVGRELRLRGPVHRSPEVEDQERQEQGERKSLFQSVRSSAKARVEKCVRMPGRQHPLRVFSDRRRVGRPGNRGARAPRGSRAAADSMSYSSRTNVTRARRRRARRTGAGRRRAAARPSPR